MGAPLRLRLADMHCHLDFASNGADLVRRATESRIGALCTTVEPRSYDQVHAAFADALTVRTALGMHPWWVAEGQVGALDVALFEERAIDASFIGEIGLDFSSRREGTFERQVDAFTRAVLACAEGVGPKVISVHAVKAAGVALDILEQQGLTRRHAVVMHWFSGTSEELVRACGLGCYFSVGVRMLATKRGRAFVRRMPADRILVETDAPLQQGDCMDPAAWESEIREALRMLDETRGPGSAALAIETAASLLGFESDTDIA